MKGWTPIASALLATVLAQPAVAQYRAPAGMVRLERSVAYETGGSTSHGDTTTISRSASSRTVGGIFGGVIGGVGGAFLGTMIGGAAAAGCAGELCQLGPALLGFGLGEAIGLGIGTHVGAGGSGSVALTSLTSVGILVGGLMLGSGAPRGTPAMALLLIPAAQLAAALAMER